MCKTCKVRQHDMEAHICSLSCVFNMQGFPKLEKAYVAWRDVGKSTQAWHKGQAYI